MTQVCKKRARRVADHRDTRILYGLWMHYIQGHWPTAEDYYGYFASKSLKRAMMTVLKDPKSAVTSLGTQTVNASEKEMVTMPDTTKKDQALKQTVTSPLSCAPLDQENTSVLHAPTSPSTSTMQSVENKPRTSTASIRLKPSAPLVQDKDDQGVKPGGDEKTYTGPYASLKELRQALEDFEGCDLKHTATHLVFGEGNPQSSVMVLGEAPGRDEDAQGRPFVGESGKLLDAMLACIGLSRQQNLYITNIIPWRPPGNRPPTPQEIQTMLPFVQAHIHLIQPQYILLIGATACRSLLKDFVTMGRVRGQFFPYTLPWQGDTPPQCFALYHPAYLLRAPLQKKVVWQDLLAFQKRIGSCT